MELFVGIYGELIATLMLALASIPFLKKPTQVQWEPNFITTQSTTGFLRSGRVVFKGRFQS